MKRRTIPVLTIVLGLTIMYGCNGPKTKQRNEMPTVCDTISTTETSKKPFTSTHIFTARYEGTSFHECLGRTAECPERCGESGNLATFEVLDYKKFEVNGEGGTEKLTTFEILTSDYHKKDLDAPFVAEIKNLKKGDEVTIHVEYVYDTTLSVVQTVRNVISLSKCAR